MAGYHRRAIGSIGRVSKSARANAAAVSQAYAVQSGLRLKPTTSLIVRASSAHAGSGATIPGAADPRR
jgi:hypothetical protein